MFDRLELWIIEKTLQLLYRLFPKASPWKKTSIALLVNLTFWVAFVATLFWMLDGITIAHYILGTVWLFFFVMIVATCIAD